MKNILTLLVVFGIASTGLHAQNVTIPDANFKAYLVGNSFINSNSDSEIQVSEAEAITYLNLNSKNIADLTGIEAFINLSVLTASANQLTSIDVSQNTELIGLNLADNQLTFIDVSQNLLLTGLNCGENSISVLDISLNTALTGLSCYTNNISNLDLSQNTALISLNCKQNNLSTLDLSHTSINKNTTLEIPFIDCSQNDLTILKMNNLSTTALEGQYFKAQLNPKLTCIEVDDVAAATSAWTNIDTTASFSLDCNYAAGINDIVASAQLSVYPNPAKDQINISTEENIERISVLDLYGRKIQSVSKTSRLIDVSGLTPGIYLLQVELDDTVVSKRFTKK